MDIMHTEEEVYAVSQTCLLSLLGMEAKVLAEGEEAQVKKMMDDLLELKLQKLELKVCMYVCMYVVAGWVVSSREGAD